MKKRLLTFMAVSLFLGTNLLLAAYTKPESGKIYRIHNVKYGKVMGENAIARELTSVEETSDDDFKQLWLLQEKATGYTLQNAYSGQYLQHCAQQSTQVYPTGDTEATIYLTQISEATYAIGQTTGAKNTIYNYMRVMQQEADKAMQRIFEHVDFYLNENRRQLLAV